MFLGSHRASWESGRSRGGNSGGLKRCVLPPRSLESSQSQFISMSTFLLRHKQSPFPLASRRLARLLCSWLRAWCVGSPALQAPFSLGSPRSRPRPEAPPDGRRVPENFGTPCLVPVAHGGHRPQQRAPFLSASVCLSVCIPSSSQLHVAQNLLTVIIIAILPLIVRERFYSPSPSPPCKAGVNCGYPRQGRGLFKARSGGIMSCLPSPVPSPQWAFVSCLHSAAGVPLESGVGSGL